ncbi:uncharacterized protein MYCFIDRAFT_173644 [Pseudocercospora fijiensis CIRAD86]|uniref:Uncharacterized protein n=1 Tax=Pseudocercospora fijiensis (strain CIRAD86) TaxID=383855 RepID=M3AJE7_PSEFD|nr:uncharacterized protein MYCFIDRAFT_173644 [Pseudocercospora fijiensis CIRAD86]EME84701.1 hypothetical protein MYCFIDRAFT_173644 [Pseudocercospora fijiensis CIRAD86]
MAAWHLRATLALPSLPNYRALPRPPARPPASLPPVAESNVATDVYALLRYAPTPACLGACRLCQVTRPARHLFDSSSTLNHSNLAAGIQQDLGRASARYVECGLVFQVPGNEKCYLVDYTTSVLLPANLYMLRHILNVMCAMQYQPSCCCSTASMRLSANHDASTLISAPSSTGKKCAFFFRSRSTWRICATKMGLIYPTAWRHAIDMHLRAWFAAHGILSSWFKRTPSCHKITCQPTHVSPGARRVPSVDFSSATTIAVLEFVDPSLQNLCSHPLQTLSYVVPCHLVMLDVRSASISNVTLKHNYCSIVPAWSKIGRPMDSFVARNEYHNRVPLRSPTNSDRIPSALMKPTYLHLPPCLMITIPNNSRHNEAYPTRASVTSTELTVTGKNHSRPYPINTFPLRAMRAYIHFVR